MKCIAFVVMMAVATHASYYESAAPAISTYSYSEPQYVKYESAPQQVGVYADHYSQKAAPVVYQAAPAPLVYSAPAPVVYKSAPAPVVYSAPAPVVYSAPAPVVYKSAPVIVKQAPVIVKAIQEEAKYTAVNRGALHEAPLPGHALSQKSVNLEPAPGTH